MRLVDDEQRRVGTRDAVHHARPGQLLGREEQKLELATAEIVEGPLALPVSKRRVEELRRQLELAQAIELVLLQGEQRRDDDRRARPLDSGELVDRRLPAAGRQQPATIERTASACPGRSVR